MAPLLRRRQRQWFRNVIENSSKAWSDLGEFSRIVPYPAPEIIGVRFGDAAFNDLRERKEGKRFVSFIAVADQASEADARCVLRHLHRQPGFTHSGPARQHHDRSAAS